MDIGHVVVGKQGGHMEIEVGTRMQRRFEIGFVPGAQGFDGTTEQFGVEGEADFLDLSALHVAEQFTGTPNLQVVCRQREA